MRERLLRFARNDNALYVIKGIARVIARSLFRSNLPLSQRRIGGGFAALCDLHEKECIARVYPPLARVRGGTEDAPSHKPARQQVKRIRHYLFKKLAGFHPL
ncbi:MAG: hypothetical protein AYP45_17205 [Candidatus Brocadia carolinensis]|uniref:Uncharacterized protein n=1 Tax=Candidatus Brocadia carolinensis TaxID=1004156 RepID=A0A1V4APD5_9BACT|nr:MAG: hypothetical protein AYP45_17205 [Candidatus Brocadia caroliniensis]